MTFRVLSGGAIALAALLLIAPNAAVGRWSWALAALIAGGAWLSLRNRRPQVAGIGFATLVVVAAAGTFLGYPLSWMAASVVAALVAWDLDHFAGATGGVEHVGNRPALEGIHLRRLLTVAAVGTVLAVAARSVDLRFGLLVALALGLLTIVALATVVRGARRGPERERDHPEEHSGG